MIMNTRFALARLAIERRDRINFMRDANIYTTRTEPIELTIFKRQCLTVAVVVAAVALTVWMCV